MALQKGRSQLYPRKRSSEVSQVRHDVRELVRVTDTLLGYPNLKEAPFTYDELYNVFRLSGDIAFNLGKMAASSEKDCKPPHKSRRSKPKLPGTLPLEDHDSPLLQLICHKCEAVATPKWRSGPDGPYTLCNVCGLVYAKRKRRGDFRPAHRAHSRLLGVSSQLHRQSSQFLSVVKAHQHV
jgi:hypothetical protein